MFEEMTYFQLKEHLPAEIFMSEISVLMEKISPLSDKPCSSCARTFVRRKDIHETRSVKCEKGRIKKLYPKDIVCERLELMKGIPSSAVDTKVWMPKDEFLERAKNGEFVKCPANWYRACRWICDRGIRMKFNKWQARRQKTNFVNRDDLEEFKLNKSKKRHAKKRKAWI